MKLELTVDVKNNGVAELGKTEGKINDIGRAASNAGNPMRDLIKTIRDLRTIIATIEMARGFAKLVEEGLKFNALLETSKLGLAALYATFTDMTDEHGKQLSVLQKYTVAQALAVDLQKRMKVAALETTLQYSDLLDAMQRGLPYMLRYFHDKQGNAPSNKQIVDFTTAFGQGAMSFGLQPEEIGTNIRGLLTGVADPRHARFAAALLSDLGPTPAKIKEQLRAWEEQGVLYDKLMDKIRAFSSMGKDAMNTYAGSLSNLKDAAQQALGEGTQTATKQLTDLFKELTSQIVTIGADGKAYFNQDLVDTIKNLASAFVTLASALSSVAKFLTIIGANLQGPNLKNLIAALGGAVAGGLLTGTPLGAAAGAGLMYWSASVGETEAQDKAQEARLMATRRQTGGDELGRLGGIFAGRGFPSQEGFERNVGALMEQLSPQQKAEFEKQMLKYITTTKSFEPGVGTHYTKSISQLDYLKAANAAVNFAGNADIKGKDIIGNEDKIRKAALALEKYREQLDRIKSTIEGWTAKDALEGLMSSYDRLIAEAKANKDDFQVVDLERMKADDKALNDYMNRLSQIEDMETKLKHTREEAKNGKVSVADEAKYQDDIKALQDAKALALDRYNKQRAENRAKAEKGATDVASKYTDEVNKETAQNYVKWWKEGIDLTLQLQQEGVQRTIDLYKNLADNLKSGLRDTFSSLLSGHGNPLKNLFDGFEKTTTEWLGSVADRYLDMLGKIAAGQPYKKIVMPNGTVADVTMGKQYQQYAQWGLGAIQGITAAYGLYQNTRNGQMSENQAALSGAASGASIGYQMGGGYGALAGAVIGAIGGYLSGGKKAGYEVQVQNGQIKIIGHGKANDAQVAQAERDVNAVVTATRQQIVSVLNAFPTDVLTALTSALPSSDLSNLLLGNQQPGKNIAGVVGTGAAIGAVFGPVGMAIGAAVGYIVTLFKHTVKGMGEDQLKEFMNNTLPQMIYDAYAPVFQQGLTALGVTEKKLQEIFSKRNEPGFDPKVALQQLQDYVTLLTGLREAAKIVNLSTSQEKVDYAHNQLNKSAVDQISELDTRMAAMFEIFKNLDFESQITYGKQILDLQNQRNQIEMQALESLRNQWLSIKDSIDQSKDSIAASELTPIDQAQSPDKLLNYWRGKAQEGMTGLLTADNQADINKYAGEAQNAAMQIYSISKQRYEYEMQMVKTITDMEKTVSQGFDQDIRNIKFDQLRLGTDAQGNPIYDKKAQADMLLGEQRDLFEQLAKATTPDEVNQIQSQIRQNASTLYELWGKTPEAAKEITAQLEAAKDIANKSLERLRQAAEDEAKKYEKAADEALAILQATADLANYAVGKMINAITALDPNNAQIVNTTLGILNGTLDATGTAIDNFDESLDRSRNHLDEFGDSLFNWKNRLDGGDGVGPNSVPGTVMTAATSQGQQQPVQIILNGSTAAIVDEVTVKVGNKVVRQVASAMSSKRSVFR